MPVLFLFVVVGAGGCSREAHRAEADRAAYETIAERNVDPRWRAEAFSVDIDRRSRYFDPNDPDRPPMPPDDPASNAYMRRVDGKKGWGHWLDDGERLEIENPAWREALRRHVGDLVLKRISARSFQGEIVQLSQITVEVDDIEDVDETAAIIETLLKKYHENQDYAVVVPKELFRQAERTRAMFNVLLVVIA